MELHEMTVRPIDQVPWSDAEAVFGTRGDPAGCWCQFYKVTSSEFSELGGAACATLLRKQVRDAQLGTGAPTPGLVAYQDGKPVGWVAVEPRTSYPTALRGKVVVGGSAEAPDDDSVWAIVCFVVRVGHRRQGIAGALIAAAVSHARSRGGRIIEGYPVDVQEREKTSAAGLYHGTVTLFARAGFEVSARPIPGRALMTLAL
ncbi:MAG TPA: GNAT family N-acetyltransferase [Galbitalea sp.]|nr:GNAT family N-acetyltransferase [Galbitalea sp.]